MPVEGLDAGSAAGGEQAQLVALVEILVDGPADEPPDGADPTEEGDDAGQRGEADEAHKPDEADQIREVDSPAEVAEVVPMVEGRQARASDIEERVEHRLSELSAAERQIVDELAADSAKGGQVSPGSQLEALDALALVAAGVLPGPLRNSVSGADVVDATGQPWDHKTTWSGSDWDARRVVSTWRTKDIARGERLIVNVERLRHQDRAELAGELARRGLSDHVVYYPPEVVPAPGEGELPAPPHPQGANETAEDRTDD